MGTSDAYDAVMAVMNFPGSARLRAILEHLMTPEQAAVAAAMPGTAPEVSEGTGIARDTVLEHLQDLVVRGIVYPKGNPADGLFRLAFSALMLHDTTLTAKTVDPAQDRKLFELWHDFSIEELDEALGKIFAQAPAPTTRVVPAYKSIQDLPDVPPWDDFREFIKSQETIAVIPCPCRYRHAVVGETCGNTEEVANWTCFQLGRGAEAALRRGAARQLTTDEALELVDKIEDDGLIHTLPNGQTHERTYHSCQCCTDCCVLVVTLECVGESVGKTWAKSCYEATVAQDKCDGCQDCVERCPFDAIEMVKPAPAGAKGKKSKKMKALVDPEKCWGCGVCVLRCNETKALTMKRVRPQEHVPLQA